MRGRHIMAMLIIGIAASGIARAQTPDSRKDEEAIKAIISATTDAFSKHDAKAWVQYCTNDAQLVTVRGESMKGVAQIEKGLATIFQTRGRHVALKTLEVSVRFVRPDVALAHVKNELSGLMSPDGQTLPPHRSSACACSSRTKARGALLRFTTLSCSVSDDTRPVVAGWHSIHCVL